MQAKCPLLVLVPRPDAPVGQLKTIVEGPPETVVDYAFHLLQAVGETGYLVRSEGMHVTLGYVVDIPKQGDPVILARDATVQTSTLEEGRCRLRLALLPRMVYRPAFATVPVSGKHVFMIPQPHRLRVVQTLTPRWLRRLVLWLFAHTGWLWLLRLIQADHEV